MIEELQRMIKEAKKAKEWISETKDQIRIVSHYDADGICSAAILTKTLLRQGKDFHLSLVKQLNDNVLKDLSGEKRSIVIFLDMGSGQIERIKETLPSRVIICDHHQPTGEPNENVIHINSVVFGINENISGSGVTYILSRTINPKNVDLASLAIIGAIGDSQIDAVGPDWGVNGLNKEILKDAESEKRMKVSKGLRLWGRYTRPLHKALEYSVDPYIPGISGSESASIQFLQELGIPVKKDDGNWRTIADLSLEEQKKLATGIIKERIRGDHENPEYIFGDVYELLDKEGEFRDANEFATMLNACGKMGEANLGVSICLNGENAFEKVKGILEKYRREVGKAMNWIHTNINNPEIVRKNKGIYVLAGSNVSEHLISNAISIVNHSGILPEKPLFGFADSEEGVKISARASDSLVEKGLKLNELMGDISEKLGGQGGGHLGAAAAIIPKGKEEDFISEVEKFFGGKEEKPEVKKTTEREGEDVQKTPQNPEKQEKTDSPENKNKNGLMNFINR
jgi:single-stranded-DNA-specific exonuclease